MKLYAINIKNKKRVYIKDFKTLKQTLKYIGRVFELSAVLEVKRGLLVLGKNDNKNLRFEIVGENLVEIYKEM